MSRRRGRRHDVAGTLRGFAARRRPQGHPQRRGGRLSGRVRASRRARDRLAVPRTRRAPDRLPRLLPERLRAADAGAAVHAPERRRGAARLARLRGLQQARGWRRDPRASGRPVKLLVIQEAGGTRSTIAEGQAWVEQTLAQLAEHAAVPMAHRRTDRRHDLRRLGCHQRPHGQSGDGPRLRLPGGDGATCIFEETGELIGWSTGWPRARSTRRWARTDRTRGQGRAVLRHLRPRQLRARQRRRRAHHDRGEVARRLRQVGAVAASPASSSPATCRRAAGCTCSTWCRTAKCASAFPTSATTRRSRN